LDDLVGVNTREVTAAGVKGSTIDGYVGAIVGQTDVKKLKDQLA
jgi:hypothetical protein